MTPIDGRPCTSSSSQDSKTRLPDYPDSDDLEPEHAKFLYEQHCAILVLEGLPVGSEFGIDMVSHRIGDKFKGVKLIPPGVHLIYANGVARQGGHDQQCGPRCGFYYDFRPQELVIKRWSVTNEEFEAGFEPTEETKERYLLNLRDLDRHLGAYRYSSYRIYRSLTNHITAELLDVLKPACGQIRSIPYLIRGEQDGKAQPPKRRFAANSAEDSLLPELNQDERTVINFAPIPQTHTELDVDASQITEFYRDSTMKLDLIFKGEPGRKRLLCELQLAFFTLLHCHVYYCFEHWKNLMALVCRADKALGKYPQFFVDFIRSIKSQLVQIPEDLFVDIVDEENLVRSHLDTLIQNINASNQDELIEESKQLKGVCQERFRWEFDLELDDELPVIVTP